MIHGQDVQLQVTHTYIHLLAHSKHQHLHLMPGNPSLLGNLENCQPSMAVHPFPRTFPLQPVAGATTKLPPPLHFPRLTCRIIPSSHFPPNTSPPLSLLPFPNTSPPLPPHTSPKTHPLSFPPLPPSPTSNTHRGILPSLPLPTPKQFLG